MGPLDEGTRRRIEAEVSSRLGGKHLNKIRNVMERESLEDLIASGVYAQVMFGLGYTTFQPAWMEESHGCVKKI